MMKLRRSTTNEDGLLSLYVLLANNYRNESLWHWSWYFCIDICVGGVVFKAMAVYLHTIARMSKIFKEAGVVFRKQMYLKAQGGKCL